MTDQSTLTRKMEDLETAQKTGKFDRAHKRGEIMYVHPSQMTDGMFWPGDLGDVIEHRILTGNGKDYEPDELRTLAATARLLVDTATFSGATDYARAWITGDISEISTRVIDGTQRDVLIVPQGLRRAQIAANMFAESNMEGHPLAGNTQAMLEVMVQTMAESGLAVPYFRGKAMVDGTSHGANGDQVPGAPPPNILFGGITWEFAEKPPYLSDPVTKIVMESPQIVEVPTDMAQVKWTFRYMPRILAWHHHLKSDVAQEYGANDVAFKGLGSSLFTDMVYTNTVYVGKGPDGETVMAFPESTNENPFFMGKTQATFYNLLVEVGQHYGIRPVKVRNAFELAHELGYQISTTDEQKIMEGVLLEKVEGVLAPGTYKGPQWVDGWITLSGKMKEFQWDGVRDAAENAIALYNNAVWAINGGARFDGRTLAADPMYATVFDLEQVNDGIIKPLSFNKIEAN